MDYRIELDAYAGPLDLLLQLVKRHEIDLHDIPVAELTDQYLAHLKLIEHLDMDQAGEFLVMAATLLEIKSQMILPRPESDDDADATGEGEDGDQTAVGDAESDPTDPRYELVQQLLAYKRFKDAARHLEHQHEQWNARFAVRPVGRPKPEKPEGDESDTDAAPREIELEDANVLELCEAFGRLLSSIGEFTGHAVTDDDTPIGLHAEDIADRLRREGPMSLRQICEGRTRGEMVGLFLAMLELVRDKRVRVEQAQLGGDVQLAVRDDADSDLGADDAETDWRDPATGEVQYDWPDESARRRHERREQRRRRRLERGDFTSDHDEDEDDDGDGDEQDDERGETDDLLGDVDELLSDDDGDERDDDDEDEDEDDDEARDGDGDEDDAPRQP